MKLKWIAALLLCWLTFAGSVHAEPLVPGPMAPELLQPSDDAALRESGYRSGRGSYSGGRASYSPGTRPGESYNTVPRSPAVTQPGNAARTGYPNRWGGVGSFLGGLAAGSLLGSLFHPFGWFGGGGYGAPGMSFFGLLFWGVVLFFVIRWFVKWRNRTSR